MVIVCHDDREDLERCLEHLLRRPPATTHEVVVVDNASRDGTPESLAAAWPQVRVLRNRDNLGFARAVNQGVAATSGELVLLLNPDTLPAGAAIDTLVAELDADPQTVAVGPRIVDGGGHPELSWGFHLGPLTELRRMALMRAWRRGRPGARRRVAVLTASRRQVDWLTGACLLLRRVALTAAGLLDERYFLYYDDVDLGAALRARGGRLLFSPAAEIVHLRGRTTNRTPERTAAIYRRSQRLYYRKHHPLVYPLLVPLLWLRAKLGGHAPRAERDGGALL